jgi:hypothetical protein
VRASPAAACRTAHLEHVAKISRILEPHRHDDRARRVVREGNALEHPVLPDEARALDMDDALRRLRAVRVKHGEIGQVGLEQDVVLRQRRPEQRGHAAADEQAEARQHACIVAKQPVADTPDIAVAVGDDEAILMLKRKLPVRLARSRFVECGKCHCRIELALVELTGHGDPLLQHDREKLQTFRTRSCSKTKSWRSPRFK